MIQADADPVGYREIALRRKVSHETGRQWMLRGVYPEPDYPAVNGFPGWEWHRIEAQLDRDETLDRSPRCSPYGTKEIADLFGVTLHTARTWKNSSKILPPPDWQLVNNYGAWDLSTLLGWAEDTGRTHRLPDEFQTGKAS